MNRSGAKDGRFREMGRSGKTQLSAGTTCVVSDGLSSHRSHSEPGATLLIVDGDFLR
ncbi:MAG: hypothetical protein KA419_15905 [Acidobacteria bacterium]|nr:hypothetical protein [Acidobacteriota bacterium]